MEDLLIAVDQNDNVIGYADKMMMHQEKMLHRAFSIFVFDWTDKTMLLQRRNVSKYHSGGLWSNACCSHPRKDEEIQGAINNRLNTELGYREKVYIVNPDKSTPLVHGKETVYGCGKFTYFADFVGLAEYEIDNVFLYSPIAETINKNDFVANPEEIQELKWISLTALEKWMDMEPKVFSAWFREAYGLILPVLLKQAEDNGISIRNANCSYGHI